MTNIEPPKFPIGTVVYDISPGQYFEPLGTRFVVTGIKFDSGARAYDYEICDLVAFERAQRDGMPLCNGDRRDGYSAEMLDTRPRRGTGFDHNVLESPVFMGYTAFPEEFHPPQEIIQRLEGEDYTDISWRNETAPRWAFFDGRDPKTEHPVACIWVEAENPKLRTDETIERFLAQTLKENGLDEEKELRTNDLGQALDFIKANLTPKAAEQSAEEEIDFQP